MIFNNTILYKTMTNFGAESCKKKKYAYYANTSFTKETIHSVEAYSELEAINYFASLKNLSISDFLTIYSIKEVED